MFVLVAYSYQSYLLKQKTVSEFKNDTKKIKIYSQWGYETQEFDKLYINLIKEAETVPILFFLYRTPYLQSKHDNIFRLTLSGYATEVAKQKEIVQTRLTYLRDRVKTSTLIPQAHKQIYFDTLEVIAGNVFEKNSDLNELKSALKTLSEQDRAITKEVESIRKESLITELQNYKSTCQELLTYFYEKNSVTNQVLAQDCIASADKLMGPDYNINGADFLETLSRERVFTLMQKASQAKQQIIQDEQYAIAAKKKEEERLTIVPPSPRQEGKIIVVNLGLQRLYAYENGVTLFPAAVPITTGKRGFETVTGEFAVYLKELQHKMASPFPGIYYDDVVNYWMPFYLGYGLHDAPWRSIYGTQDYGVVGSHGCVNIPLPQTSILYNWAEVGTRVIVI
ncbi:MAG: L,D-transpeptidase [bacterium]